MTVPEILNSSLNKTQKAYKLYELGYTRQDVSELITNGNYGFAHNIWKKWNQIREERVAILPFEFSFSRTFGIELEIFGATKSSLIAEFARMGIQLVDESYNHSTRNHWKIVSDSSIRGENGNEIVSPILQGVEGMEQIKKVCIALNRAKAQVNKTCGFHLHLGASDLSVQNFKSLTKSFISVEHQFDKIVPASRRTNQYCQSNLLGRSKARVFAQIDSTSTIRQICDICTSRYVKLNLKSYTRQGTVEFRQHSGTITFSKIKNWIMICARLVEYSKRNQIATNFNQFLNESLQDYCEDREVDLAV